MADSANSDQSVEPPLSTLQSYPSDAALLAALSAVEVLLVGHEGGPTKDLVDATQDPRHS